MDYTEYERRTSRCTYCGCDTVDTADETAKLEHFGFGYSHVIQGLLCANNTFDFL